MTPRSHPSWPQRYRVDTAPLRGSSLIYMKICSHCKVEKGLEAFSNSSASKDGKFSMCRVCLSESSKKSRLGCKERKLPYRLLDSMKICSRCKIEKSIIEFTICSSSKDGLHRNCKACTQAKNNAGWGKNKSSWNALRREKRATDPEYREKNLQACKEYADTVEGRLSHQRASSRYYRANKQKHFALIYARRQKFVQEITAEEWSRVMSLHNNTCIYCGGIATGKDHVVPVTSGGRDVIHNVVPACIDCNRKKSAIPVEVWVTRKFDNHEEILDRVTEALALQTSLLYQEYQEV